MSVFSKYFNVIKERRNLNSADVARICGIDTTVVYKWTKGEHTPRTWSVLEKVVERMHLSNVEKKELQHTYERTILGDEKYNAYQKIIEILSCLQKRGNEYNSRSLKGGFIDNIHLKPLPDFMELHNKIEIIQCIQNVFTYMLVNHKQNLYLKVQPVHQDIITQIQMYYNQIDECNLEEIVYFVNESYDSTIYNLEIIKGLINLLVQKNPIQIYSQDKSETEAKKLDNWILTDDFILEFANDFSYGMIATNQNLVAHFRKHYEEIKKSSKILGKKRCTTPEDFLFRINEERKFSYSALEYMPCLGNCLTEEILQQHILEELPDRERLMDRILEYSRFLNSGRVRKGRSFFFRQGLIEFMETGNFKIFPYEVYNPPKYEACCNIVQNGIEFAKEGLLDYQMVKDDQLPMMKEVYIEQASGDSKHLIIDIHFNEGKKERFEIYSEEIRKVFEGFFDFLADSAYVYSVEETVEQMQEIVDEYRRKAKKD